MDLRQFVSETLTQIVGGIEDAKKSITDGSARINPRLNPHSDAKIKQLVDDNDSLIQDVVFDVALTVSSGTGTSGKVSVLAGLLNLESGGKSSNDQGRTSRVQFKVAVSFPKG